MSDAGIVRKSDLAPKALAPTLRCKSMPCYECGERRHIRDVTRRLCKLCYNRLHKAGLLPPRSWEVAFTRLTQPAENGCIEWLGAISSAGYGTWGKQYAHRRAFTCRFGPIAEGLTVDHLCRNRACVNPDHLEAVSQGENSRRATSLITHCVNGHEFTLENTRLRDGRRRSCRTCDNTGRLR